MSGERHVVALSGGKDSAALAIYLKDKWPNRHFEYVFTDSGCELPETYEYLDRIRAVINIGLTWIKPDRGFDYWLKYYNGMLPSPQNRWCTRHLKIEPYKRYLKGGQPIYSYIALRADEKERKGYNASGGSNIIPVYPFIEDGIVLNDVFRILFESGLGKPGYSAWKKRSGCYFCFYQSTDEWAGLKKYHLRLFEKACAYEESHNDGRVYTWRGLKGGKHQFVRDAVATSESTSCSGASGASARNPLDPSLVTSGLTETKLIKRLLNTTRVL